jgi:hypothetical protein
MRNKIIALYIGVALFGCSKREVNWNPYYPNYGITKNEIIGNVFALSSADDGICVYSKRIGNKHFYFYLSFENSCEVVETQVLDITLRKNIRFDPYNPDQPIEFTLKDSISIVEVLEAYKAKKTSNFGKGDECTSTFKARNEEGKILEWDLSLCGEFLTMSAYEKINIQASNTTQVRQLHRLSVLSSLR